jgi:hypothetical protein
VRRWCIRSRWHQQPPRAFFVAGQVQHDDRDPEPLHPPSDTRVMPQKTHPPNARELVPEPWSCPCSRLLLHLRYRAINKVAHAPIGDSPGRSMKIAERSHRDADSKKRRVHSNRGPPPKRGHVDGRNSAAYAKRNGHLPGHRSRVERSRSHAHPLRAVRAAVFPQAPQRRRQAARHITPRYFQ